MVRYRKDINDCLLRLSKLPEKTQKIINEFLSSKKKGGSRSTYLSPILALFELADKEYVNDLTVDDYENILSYYGEGTTGFRCIKSFFKYLDEEYLLHDENHLFNIKFRDERKLARQKTHNNKSKSTNKNGEYTPALTFDQVQQLNEFINFDFDDIGKLQCSFICYILFCTDCPEKVLEKEIKASDYKDGKINLANGLAFDIPKRYEPMFKNRVCATHRTFAHIQVNIYRIYTFW